MRFTSIIKTCRERSRSQRPRETVRRYRQALAPKRRAKTLNAGNPAAKATGKTEQGGNGLTRAHRKTKPHLLAPWPDDGRAKAGPRSRGSRAWENTPVAQGAKATTGVRFNELGIAFPARPEQLFLYVHGHGQGKRRASFVAAGTRAKCACVRAKVVNKRDTSAGFDPGTG